MNRKTAILLIALLLSRSTWVSSRTQRVPSPPGASAVMTLRPSSAAGTRQ